ncbi:MAG: serine hydrolase [Terrimonas sp.]|nr:serine hydrolase [Terrimonas sp.]
MKTHHLVSSLICILFITSCQKASNDPVPPAQLYFPPVTGNEWQTGTPASLGWNENAVNDLYTFLDQKNTKAFIVLKNGRMVMEKYFGSFIQDSLWYWASAGKTLTAMLVGIAQHEGILNINNKTSDYLGNGWSSLSPAKENLVTVKNQLTMTTGLDDNVADDDCTDKACLQYKADAGTRWAYHNAPYTLLENVIVNASGKNYNSYCNEKISSRIGMSGFWLKSGYNNVFYSNARSMARFGLLLLAKGVWDQVTVLPDNDYFSAMTSSSQPINPSYGYLTWLNGKNSYMLPESQISFSGAIIPNAPPDLFAALGKNDQKIYVVPSQQLVVIRMGNASGIPLYALSNFDNELWGHLKSVIGY